MFDGSLPEIGGMRTLTDRELITAAAGWGRAENAAAARKLAAMAELFRRRTGCDDATDRHHWFVDPEASAVNELAPPRTSPNHWPCSKPTAPSCSPTASPKSAPCSPPD